MRFWVFESKKYLANPKNIICLSLLVFIIFGLFGFNQIVLKPKLAIHETEMVNLNLQESQRSVEELERMAQISPNDEEVNTQLGYAKEIYNIRLEQKSALDKGDFSLYSDLENNLNKFQLSQIEDKDSKEYKEVMKRIDYHQSIKSVNGVPSIIINDTTDTSFVIGRTIVSWLSSTTFLVLFTILLADNLSSEIESSQIRLYHFLGRGKVSHLITKLIVPVFWTFLATIMSFGVLYLVKGVMDGFGTWQYPYLTEDKTIVPIWSITLKSVLLFLSSLFFITSLGQLLSLVFKKSLVTIGMIVVSLTGFATIAQEEWFQSMKKFFPFEYMGYDQILNDSAVLPDNVFLIGMTYLLTLSIIFFIISNYLYKNYFIRKVGKA
ncbi:MULTISPECIES: ABC transporter permease [Streptococcus]|uniref:ABC transporter permease n=1 Tax=Streptococcus caledonicus TaxID=2614158 RepID=A0ABW0U999_9STRE|nr:ABC transporter permease [Streptococcus sp. S784/96/1]